MSGGLNRRQALGALAASAALASGAAHARTPLRISYQRSSTLLTLLKQDGALEKQLGPQGFDISWHELSGAPLLAALNSGSVDLHADVADAYALFTQAAGAPLTYFARENPAPTAQALLVAIDSPIARVADLRGKRVAVPKGTGAHYLTLNALKQAGLKPSDVDLRFLEPTDAVAAFNGGSIDAFAVWDPFLAVQLQTGKLRVLADGRNGLVAYQRFYTATTTFAQAHPAVLKQVFEALQAQGKWVKAHPDEAAERLSPIWGNVPAATVAQVNTRRSYDIVPVRRQELGEQQRIADAFLEAALIPRALQATDIAVWAP